VNKIMRFIPVFLGILIGMLPALVNAATFGSYDPRSLAMGGAGVSHANIDHAAYYNPALLSVAQEDDDFSLLAPTIGIRAYDPDELLDALDAYQDGQYETTFNNAIDDFNAAPTLAEKEAAATVAASSARQLVDGLINISDKALDFELHAGLGLAIPSKGLGFAVTGSGRLMGGIVLKVTDEDQALLNKYVDAINCAALLASNPADPCGPVQLAVTDPVLNPDGSLKDPQGNLTSYASIQGIAIIEGGVSIAHEFESLDNWSIGITPKTVQVTTYDYKVGVENADFDTEAGELDYEDTNIDIGLAKRISEGWKVGLVVKNAVKKEYKTVLGNTIVLEPTARAGISHHTNWTTIALDVDLTENESIGLTGEKTQYAALGMEFDLALLQLRVGARHNMSVEGDREANILSAGVGLYIIGLHIDAGVAKNDDEVAAAIQLGFQF